MLDEHILTPEQVKKFHDDGYLVLPDFFTSAQVTTLLNKAHKLLDEFSLEGHPMTKFSTGDNETGEHHIGDDYFLSSGDKIRYFFEEGAFDKEGNLVVPKERSINKIGHGLHELDPDYNKFTLRNRSLITLAKDLGVHKDPLVLQSMLIFKQPSIGAALGSHNDSTFLYTNKPSALGFWFALEDCTLTNGCLSFAPGSHKKTLIKRRFIRKPEGGTGFEEVPADKLETIEGEEQTEWRDEEFKVEECKAGTLVLIHGSVIHRSEANHSEKSRFIYTFHMIESEAEGAVYDEKNWLQPTKEMPFSRLFADNQ